MVTTAAALKDSLARDLADRLAVCSPPELAERTGLPQEPTITELCSNTGQDLFSWEVISACLAAAGTSPSEMATLHTRWEQVEAALWAEREPDLLLKIRSDLEREKERAKADRRAFDKKASDKQAFDTHRPQAPWRKVTGPSARYTPWAMSDLPGDRQLADPATATSVKQFYELLKQLHVWAGRPSANEIEYRSWGALSHSTANTMLGPTRYLQKHQQGRGLDHDNVRYLAAVFGLPAEEVTRWTNAYDQVRRLPPVDVEAEARRMVQAASHEAAAAKAELAGEVQRRRAAEESLAEAMERANAAEAVAERARRETTERITVVQQDREQQLNAVLTTGRRWKPVAFVLAGALLLTLVATIVQAGGGRVTSAPVDPFVILQFPKPYLLVPGPPGVTIPLDLPATVVAAEKTQRGDWTITVRMHLVAASQADTCVHDSQVAYSLRSHRTTISAASLPKGQADLSTGPLRLGRDPHDLQIILVVTVPAQTGTGCEFTLDPSGTTATHQGH